MTPKQELFCQEYLLDCNATRAAIRAGFSPNSANEYAAELMNKDDIRDRIGSLMEERARRVGINQAFVLGELIAIARTGEGMERLKALELLGKHMQLFNDKLDVNINLARQAEHFSKLSQAEQLQLMKEEVKRLEGSNVGKD